MANLSVPEKGRVECFDINPKTTGFGLRVTDKGARTWFVLYRHKGAQRRFTVSNILNHKQRGITAVYDRYTYAPEIKHALDAWGARIEKILSGKELWDIWAAGKPADALAVARSTISTELPKS